MKLSVVLDDGADLETLDVNQMFRCLYDTCAVTPPPQSLGLPCSHAHKRYQTHELVGCSAEPAGVLTVLLVPPPGLVQLRLQLLPLQAELQLQRVALLLLRLLLLLHQLAQLLRPRLGLAGGACQVVAYVVPVPLQRTVHEGEVMGLLLQLVTPELTPAGQTDTVQYLM